MCFHQQNRCVITSYSIHYTKLYDNSIKSIFRPPKQAITITDTDPQIVETLCEVLGLSERLNGLMIDRFAINVAINLIAGLVSKCEFKTYKAGRPFVGKEYYLWNIEPNTNQNSTQFLQEVIS